MSDVSIKWHIPEVTDAVRKMLVSRLRRVGSEMRSYIIKKISEGKTRSQGPSQPGNPPHVDTGRLRQSIFFRVDAEKLTVMVGTNLLYGLWLELSTSKMAARPFLRPSLLEMHNKIVFILTKK